MKKIIYFSLAFIVMLLSFAQCKRSTNLANQEIEQNLTVQDSIQFFSDSLFSMLKENYLYKDKVPWNEIKTRFEKNASKHTTFENSLKESRDAFDSIGCDHCMLFSENGYYPASPKKQLLYKDYSYEFSLKHSEGVKFSVSKLGNTYGYIEMPGMLLLDLSQEELNAKTQEMYDQIVMLDKNNDLKGWIIDLRFNTGGNSYPMINALHYLLGDKVIYNELNINKEIEKVNKLENGKFYSGEKVETEIKTTSKNPDVKIPVALIIGNWTASAGETVILGFKGRENVITIGEPTYGHLTANSLFELPFKVQAPLTTGYLADMYGDYSENLSPDLHVKEEKNNFENLLEDQNIIEAIKFIESKN
ncbi:S41 family peptidase [Aquimarina sp. 2201CG5-10]|uniref:S41 family peptidase n=1 Tax=Aquimarina callyspongiae TaxID=3098150 RepID=UPI002AB5B713|nr:S41 family peptidase [Aquimarina sp. 2201CG5-10]MDY8137481.1 S41 family peptidase [Aquimarina sp. 2201CG5-10]